MLHPQPSFTHASCTNQVLKMRQEGHGCVLPSSPYQETVGAFACKGWATLLWSQLWGRAPQTLDTFIKEGLCLQGRLVQLLLKLWKVLTAPFCCKTVSLNILRLISAAVQAGDCLKLNGLFSVLYLCFSLKWQMVSLCNCLIVLDKETKGIHVALHII